MLTRILQDILTPTDLTQLRFRLSDFIGVSPEDDREVSFKWHHYHMRIENEMKYLAISRYRETFKKRGGPADPDYQPPSQDSKSSSQDSELPSQSNEPSSQGDEPSSQGDRTSSQGSQ